MTIEIPDEEIAQKVGDYVASALARKLFEQEVTSYDRTQYYKYIRNAVTDLIKKNGDKVIDDAVADAVRVISNKGVKKLVAKIQDE